MLMRLRLFLERLMAPKAERPSLKEKHHEWLRRHRKNDPLSFWIVEEGEGTPVGPVIEVAHLTMYDMAHHAIWGELTTQVLLRGLKANAYRHTGFDRVDRYNGITKIQPIWADLVVHLLHGREPLCGLATKPSTHESALIRLFDSPQLPAGHRATSYPDTYPVTCQSCLEKAARKQAA